MSDRPWFRIFTSVTLQPYANIEALVIDSYSTDRTRDIAASYQTRVILCEGKLLAARYLGCKDAKGSYIVFVDTDQILEPTAIERAVALTVTTICWLSRSSPTTLRGLFCLFLCPDCTF